MWRGDSAVQYNISWRGDQYSSNLLNGEVKEQCSPKLCGEVIQQYSITLGGGVTEPCSPTIHGGEVTELCSPTIYGVVNGEVNLQCSSTLVDGEVDERCRSKLEDGVMELSSLASDKEVIESCSPTLDDDEMSSLTLDGKVTIELCRPKIDDEVASQRSTMLDGEVINLYSTNMIGQNSPIEKHDSYEECSSLVNDQKLKFVGKLFDEGELPKDDLLNNAEVKTLDSPQLRFKFSDVMDDNCTSERLNGGTVRQECDGGGRDQHKRVMKRLQGSAVPDNTDTKPEDQNIRSMRKLNGGTVPNRADDTTKNKIDMERLYGGTVPKKTDKENVDQNPLSLSKKRLSGGTVPEKRVDIDKIRQKFGKKGNMKKIDLELKLRKVTKEHTPGKVTLKRLKGGTVPEESWKFSSKLARQENKIIATLTPREIKLEKSKEFSKGCKKVPPNLEPSLITTSIEGIIPTGLKLRRLADGEFSALATKTNGLFQRQAIDVKKRF